MILLSHYEEEKRNSFFPFTPHAQISEPWNAKSTWQYILSDQKNTCLESLSHICSERLKSAPVCGGCLFCGKDRIKGRDGRNTCKKKWNYWSLISVTSVLVSLMPSDHSALAQKIQSGMEPLPICLVLQLPPLIHAPKSSFLVTVSPFTLGIFARIHCYEVYDLHCPLNLLIVVICSWFFFPFPFLTVFAGSWTSFQS